ncbi:fibrinogen-like protein 1 isoform X2 [Embiotoca jacksoni]|uniref:fibrinogen-like protein 1 isoform X2 n=1 Tax=Embiotoca jacksoni TaxID=100190 RepID=UPI003704CC48
MSVVNDRHRYILELHNVQSQQPEQIPSTHLGADNLRRGKYDLRIDMEDLEGNRRFAEYKNFKVDDEKVKPTHVSCLKEDSQSGSQSEKVQLTLLEILLKSS